MTDIGEAIAVIAGVGYFVGIPLSIGVGIAAGFGPLSILFCPLWPFTAMIWLGYWLAT